MLTLVNDDVDPSSSLGHAQLILGNACVVTLMVLLHINDLQPTSHLPAVWTASHVHRYAIIITWNGRLDGQGFIIHANYVELTGQEDGLPIHSGPGPLNRWDGKSLSFTRQSDV